MPGGYATVSLEEIDARPLADGTVHDEFTSDLGCTATAVDGYRMPAGGAVPLAAAPEQLCLPVGAIASVHLGEDREIPPVGAGLVPAGVECMLKTTAQTVIAVISATPESTAGGTPATVDLDACEYAVPATSSIKTARLTAPLGCAGMKVNARILEPLQRVPYHTEGDQEELFVPLRGPAAMLIDGAGVDTPVGTITRVDAPVPRSAVNDGDAPALWVMVGAPPTGGPDEWDPGSEILE